MADTIVFLQVEHVRFARLLDLVEPLIERLGEASSTDVTLFEMVLTYFSEFPDACHHPKEDVVFRRLREVDPEAAERVGNLLGDHEELSAVTHAAADRFRTARAERDLGNEELRAGLQRFVRLYRQHLIAEDTWFFPIVLDRLSREDLERIDFSVFDQPDPVYDQVAESRFAELRRRLASIAGTDRRANEG